MEDNQIIVGLVTIVVFGVGAQWVGRRLGFPSLLLLLPAGLLAGDVFGLVEPEELFGDTLFPLVTLLVALLLFQSGLKLRLSELPRDARGPVFRLVGIGGAITFLGASLAVLVVVGVDSDLAFLVGAIIVVSGPTVVGPLLDVVRPRQPTGSVLNWEGTFLDPVGATLGVVVLNLVLASGRGGVHPVLQMSARLAVGILVGLAAAALLVFVMSRFLLTDNMEAAVSLLFAVAAFGVADVLLSEAGLFATVTLGFVAANQRVVPTARSKGFGETLEVIIIGTLFILLGALVEVDALREHAWRILGVVAVLVLLVRPLSVAVALVRSKLAGRDRALIAGMDPRGIVAASTAAQFSATLSDSGFDSDFILPVVFGVILGTGIVYGLGAAPLARGLGVSLPAPRGVGLIGDAPWLADLARKLQDCGVSVLLVTSGDQDAATPGTDPVPRISMKDSEEQISSALKDAGLAQVLIASPSSPLLSVVAALFVERLGRRHVWLLPGPQSTGIDSHIATHATAHPFARGTTRTDVEQRVAHGATVEVVDRIDEDMLPLVAVKPDGAVDLEVADRTPGSEETIIALVGN
jgi:NhaP-type Na+/H+ or K+/H+ antiporter